MQNTVQLTHADIRHLAAEKAAGLSRAVNIYGVPRGGVCAALAFAAYRPSLQLVDSIADADVIVDDIIDTGATRERYKEHGKPFVALVDKTGREVCWKGRWIQFPWENKDEAQGPEDNVRRLLEWIGEDPNREGLRETPSRVCRAYKDMCSGYYQDPAAVVKAFEDGVCDEMVCLKGIFFASSCEHHLLPFTGVAHIAYIPNKRVIGISKLARLLDIYSHRLQVQERLTQQVTSALDDHLKPLGSACVIEALHTCISCRGVGKQGATMITSSLTGAFRNDAITRAEFFGLVRG